MFIYLTLFFFLCLNGIWYLCRVRSFCILLYQLLARRAIREFSHVEGQEDRQEDR